MEQKYMRIMLFFDLPTLTSQDKYEYNRFRKYLLRNGFYMMQLSIYTRICKGDDSAKKIITQLDKNAPLSGNVRILKVTEKQFCNMKIILGTPKKAELERGKQLILF